MLEQLEEARVLWRNIKKRTGVVAGYIQQNLPFQVCTTATRVSNCALQCTACSVDVTLMLVG